MRSRPCISLVLAIASTFLSQGCISAVFRPGSDLGAVPYPPVEPSSVRVLSRAPSVPFTVLGEIEAVVTGYYSEEAVLSRIRKAAALKGANAIVFVRDVSMMAAAGDGDPDSAWRKRHSLVYEAVLLPDASVP
jgi:hypothetical protein